LYPTVAPTSPTLVKIVLTMGIRLTSSTVDTESAIKQTLALILSLEPSDFKHYRMTWHTSLISGTTYDEFGTFRVEVYVEHSDYIDAETLLTAMTETMNTAIDDGDFTTTMSSECECDVETESMTMQLGKEYPTLEPTPYPTLPPSHDPTGLPTYYPSQTPTLEPTHSPSRPTQVPTKSPTAFPSSAPSALPSTKPSHAPTPSPTHLPTMEHPPTPLPSQVPTHPPTAAPSHQPTTFEEKQKFKKHHPRHENGGGHSGLGSTSTDEPKQTSPKPLLGPHNTPGSQDGHGPSAERIDVAQLDMESTISAEVESRAEASLRSFEIFTQEVDSIRAAKKAKSKTRTQTQKVLLPETKTKRMPVSIFDFEPNPDFYRELNLDAVKSDSEITPTEVRAGDRFSAFSAIGGALVIIGVVAAMISLSGNDPSAAFERRRGYDDIDMSSPL
jgi:hypothetical protein